MYELEWRTNALTQVLFLVSISRVANIEGNKHQNNIRASA